MQPVASLRDAPWRHDAPLRALFNDYVSLGGHCLIVGGAVRDALWGREAGDIDMAGTLPPDAALEGLQKLGYRVIATGLAHGTITVMIAPQRAIEITTLRKDVSTDGRHAQVRWGASWREDAARRDFTVNALYADMEGCVFDPLDNGALGDVQQRRIIFIGDARARLREDYLRALRYIRFSTQLAVPLDAMVMALIAAQGDGLWQLSGERVWQELRAILTAAHSAHAVHIMGEYRLWDMLALPVLVDAKAAFEAVQGAEKAHHMAADIAVRLAAIMAADSAKAWNKRLAWPRALRREVAYLLSHETVRDQSDLLLHRLNVGDAMSRKLLLQAAARGHDNALLWKAMELPMPAFELSGDDVMRAGVAQGAAVGQWLMRAKIYWAQQQGAPRKHALIEWLESQTS